MSVIAVCVYICMSVCLCVRNRTKTSEIKCSGIATYISDVFYEPDSVLEDTKKCLGAKQRGPHTREHDRSRTDSIRSIVIRFCGWWVHGVRFRQSQARGSSTKAAAGASRRQSQKQQHSQGFVDELDLLDSGGLKNQPNPLDSIHPRNPIRHKL